MGQYNSTMQMQNANMRSGAALAGEVSTIVISLQSGSCSTVHGTPLDIDCWKESLLSLLIDAYIPATHSGG